VFCFELTESAAIANLGKAEVLMRRLRGLGCTIALDDFGTGLSSLAYLRALPVDMLKIDGSFVRDILKDPRAESMVQAIAQLARSMKMTTVAEYVESDEIRLRVATLGVDYGQGFAIARPVSMADTMLELPMYATRVAYGRELDGLLRDSENIDQLQATDVAELAGDAPAGDGGADRPYRQLGPDDNTQRRLENILEDSCIDRGSSQQRRSGNT
jgi:c-di-GMP-related signal transduction protein